MDDRKKEEKELEALKGFVHTGPSSPWTGMKMASLMKLVPETLPEVPGPARQGGD